jgi:molecular chaperone GrpE (heat shock protein)
LEKRLNEQQGQLGKQQEQLNKLPGVTEESSDGAPAWMDALGPLGFLTSPLIFSLFMALFALALGLHVVHLLRAAQAGRSLREMWQAVQQKNAAAGRATMPVKNPGMEKLAEQVRQQGQGLSQFTAQLNQLQGILAERDRQLGDAVQALALTANWVGQFQLREAAAADGGQITEAERAAGIALLERYKEPLRINASRVESVAQAMAELVERLEAYPQLPAEMVGKAQSLYQEIGKFDVWQTKVTNQLAALQRGSFARRSSMLQDDQQKLFEHVRSGQLSISQMVQQSRALLDQHFPNGAANSSNLTPTAEDEAELKKRIDSAEDELMDWFDNFSQFQSQMTAQAARAPLDPDTANALARIQQFAREALGKFDIQPEEIQVGRTNYDRRLHDATLVRQSSQFPINTVIEVLRYGFRRMSTGQALRRPQVVVAGAVAG